MFIIQVKIQCFFVLLLIYTYVIHDVQSIIGGKIVDDEYKYRFIISLRDIRRHFCAGAILNSNWVISAAHCIIDYYGNDKELAIDRVSIYAGTLLRRENRQAQVYQIEDYVLKDGFLNPEKHDIVLIRIKDNFHFNARVSNINIPRENNLKENDIVTALGWGEFMLTGQMPLKLREIDLTVFNLALCQARHPLVGDFNFCTLDGHKYGTMSGDSGGPLIGPNGDLVGIISYDVLYNEEKGVTLEIHTDLYHYRKWIDFWIDPKLQHS